MKFTGEGSITVDAHAHPSGVEISILDTGIELPEKALSLIFEPFHHTQHSTTDQYEGMGLRLHIVKRLLARNTDVNARYAHDLTLLMWASGADENVTEAEAIKVVTYLLDAGARIDNRDARGRTALMIAAEGGRAKVATLLLARGADPSLKDNAGKRAADLTTLSLLRDRLTRP